MPDETLADLYASVFGRSAAQRYASTAQPVRPRPRVMRPVEERRLDRNPGVRAQADRQAYDAAQRSMAPIRGERAPPSNQFAEASGMALEATGLPSIRRSASAFTRGDVREGVNEGAMGALGLAGLATLSPRGAMRPAPRPMPQRTPPTRIYRGLNQEHDPQRAALLGDRWWHTSPEVASTYAPGSEGAHVMPGVVDEGALRLARIQAPPGTTSRHIPVDALPPDVRRAFPRSRTHVTSHEVAAAAESAGYEGVTFSGIRDSGYAGAMEGPYPGFGTGDEGRVFALFRDDAVRSPFGAPQPPRPMPRAPDAGRSVASNGGRMRAAIRDLDTGEVYTGDNHFFAAEAAQEAGARNLHWEGGFLDEAGNYLTREQAAQRLGITHRTAADAGDLERVSAPRAPDGGNAGAGARTAPAVGPRPPDASKANRRHKPLFGAAFFTPGSP